MKTALCKGWVISRLIDGFFWDNILQEFTNRSMTVFETWKEAENEAHSKLSGTYVSVWPVLVESR